MHDPATSQLSRRQALKLGVGVAAAAAGSGALGTLAVAATAPISETSETRIDGVGIVELVDGPRVRAHMANGGKIIAELIGFPTEVTPRVGDLVAIDTGVNQPLCAPTGSETNASAITRAGVRAYPLCHWTVGTPSVSGATAMVGSLRLVASPAIRAAAQRNMQVSVCTLDTTLPVHLILAIRPAA